MRALLASLLAILLLAAIVVPARAAWPNSPYSGLLVGGATGAQVNPVSASDGSGGAFVAWLDQRAGYFYVYAQHVLGSGIVDPAWTVNGMALCPTGYDKGGVAIVSDGSGGAIIAWYDYRTIGSGNDIYAQHVLASGVVDPAWPVNGRAVCVATGNQNALVMTADGSGGALLAWVDQRSGANYDVYVQHVLASGAVDPAWPVDGRALCTATGDQQPGAIVTDGAGGAIVAWIDLRLGATNDIYAGRVLASGVADPAWPVNGRALCLAAGNQWTPSMLPDGSGGAFVAWHDQRSGTNYDVYAQHVSGSGTLDTFWPSNGLAVCTATNDQNVVTLVSDGAGGMIASWQDSRVGGTNIYAQRVLPTGSVDPAWPVDGRALCATANTKLSPQSVSDGAGGAIVAWYDGRTNYAYDVYAQHVLSTGAVDPAWPTDGRAICTTFNYQWLSSICTDGSGGAIVTWYDLRTGVYDVYSQRVARYSYLGTPEGELVSVKDVPNDQGGKVKVSWNASYLEVDPYNLVTNYRVYRSVPPALAASMRAAGANIASASGADGSFLDRPGTLLATVTAGTTYYWEYVASVSADYLAGYSALVPTAEDSTAAGAPLTAFMVQARTAGSHHWESQPVSAYSVDNLPPAAPVPFTGQFASGTTRLHWSPNVELDLAGYRLYRGASPSFVPGPATLFASPQDTGYVDVAGVPAIYKLTALDAHGNESAASTLTPAGTTAVDDGAQPAVLSLALPWPNPAATSSTLRFDLPTSSHARLAIYDAAGRQVRVLADGTYPAGAHAESWDLRDANGRAASSGLYFVRFESSGRTCVRRVVVAR